MTPERWQEIEDILDQVMPRPLEERTAQLDRLCGEDATLRNQVEEMLVYCDQAQEEAFLEASPLANAQHLVLGSILEGEPEVGLQAGDSVRSYRIVKHLDGGGMGEVYLAERTDPHMRVALKVVKRGMDTDEILRRFRYEREILARLEHPNIARLHDAGVTDDGRPFFAMEYVEEGQPLDAYCDEHNLSVRARLELFTTVCEAVRYAHRNLVVHRDLKPGNILVSRDEAGHPLVKLLDFGIAKLLEEDAALHTVQMTEVGARRMTPNYAAPEQITGGATTTATDVYALGVILFKLLTGRRPYYFGDKTAIGQVICHTMPDRPSTVVVRSTRSNGAAETTPEHLGQQRAASPKGLRRQLKGDLDAIVLMALRKEPERRYASAAEFLDDIRRYLDHRPVVAQPDSVAYRSAKFVRRHKIGVAVGVFVLVALAGTGAVTWQANVAAQQAEREAEREAERADVTLGVIRNMLRKVSPQSAQGATFSARDLIKTGLLEMEALQNQPRAQAEMMNEMGRVSRGVGLFDLADSLHRQALAIQQRELGPDDPDVAVSLMWLARTYQAQGSLDKAEETYRRSIAVRPDYAAAYGNLGLFYRALRRYEEAIPHLEKVTELRPDDYRGYTNLSVVYIAVGRWVEARQMLEQSIALKPSYRAYSNLAWLYFYHEARYADAARMYDKALELNDQGYQFWGYLAAAHYWAPGGRDQALRTYRQAIEMAEDMLREVNPDDAEVLSRLATYYAMIGKADEALACIERALDLAPADENVMFRASYAYEQLGEREAALQWMKQALTQGYPLADVEREPGFRELRTDPRFQQVLQGRSDAS